MVGESRTTDGLAGSGGNDRVVVVTADSHVGPRLSEDLRACCEDRYLEAFDEFAEAMASATDFGKTYESRGSGDGMRQLSAAMTGPVSWNLQTAGHYDVHQRLKDMDWDGVAAEVIFHGSQNTQTLPFHSKADPNQSGPPRGR